MKVVCIIAAVGILFTFVSHGISQWVFAHVPNEYGNVTLETGWDQEPPFVDEINYIFVGVTRESENEEGSSTPVRNALADMDIVVKYGGVTKSLNFVPSQEQEGMYESKILPNRIGSYGLVLNGTIQDQPISDEIQIEDVESKQTISFPVSSSGGGTSSMNLVIAQISNVLNQITNDINNIREDIRTLAEANSNIQQGIQNIRDVAKHNHICWLSLQLALEQLRCFEPVNTFNIFLKRTREVNNRILCDGDLVI